MFRKILNRFSKFGDWMAQSDREMREAGYIVSWPPIGCSFGAPHVHYIGPPKKPHINTQTNDRPNTISGEDPRT
jgi:hypothetical protein